MVRLLIELSGGLELLFGGEKEHNVDLAKPEAGAGEELRVEELLRFIKQNLLKERPELFLKDDTVRPGILVLINDVDWELCGNLHAPLHDGDRVNFISTLHGG